MKFRYIQGEILCDLVYTIRESSDNFQLQHIELFADELQSEGFEKEAIESILIELLFNKQLPN
jgi:hypothetical protein